MLLKMGLFPLFLFQIIVSASKCSWLLYVDFIACNPNQAKIPTKLPSQMGSPSVIFALVPVWREMSSAKIWALVAISSTLLLCLFLIHSGQALQISPVILVSWDQRGHPGKHPATLGEVDAHFGIFFPHWRSCRPSRALSVWPCACLGEGWCCQSIVLQITLLTWSFLVSVVQGVVSPHPCVLAFSQSCLVYGHLLVGLLVRGTEVRNDLCCHLDDITCNSFLS